MASSSSSMQSIQKRKAKFILKRRRISRPKTRTNKRTIYYFIKKEKEDCWNEELQSLYFDDDFDEYLHYKKSLLGEMAQQVAVIISFEKYSTIKDIRYMVQKGLDDLKKDIANNPSNPNNEYLEETCNLFSNMLKKNVIKRCLLFLIYHTKTISFSYSKKKHIF